MYDLQLAQAALRGTDDPVAAAHRGVFQLWTDAVQVRPLFDYAKASQATTHSLMIAGFDMQVTADGVLQHFASDLRDFVGALIDPELNKALSALAIQALDARARLFSSNFAAEADLKRWTRLRQACWLP